MILLLFFNILFSNNISQQKLSFETTALELRFENSMYINIFNRISHPLLKKHYIILWIDRGQIIKNYLRLSSRHYTKVEEDSFINNAKREGKDIVGIPIPFEMRIAGIGYDTTAYLFDNKKIIRSEFNKMIESEALTLDSSDKVIELAKLYICLINKAVGFIPGGSLSFADELDDFETFLKKYKNEQVPGYRDNPFWKYDTVPKNLFYDSLFYYRTHPEAQRQNALSEEEIDKLLQKRGKEYYDKKLKLLQRYKPWTKIWCDDNNYRVQIYTYDVAGEIRRWRIKISPAGIVLKSSVKKECAIRLFGCLLQSIVNDSADFGQTAHFLLFWCRPFPKRLYRSRTQRLVPGLWLPVLG